MARRPLVIGPGNVRSELTSADALEVPGALQLSGVSVVTLSSNASDYALPATTSALLIDCDTADVEIAGMQGGAQGREVAIGLRQSSAHGLILKARSGPTTANWFATEVDTVLEPGEGATFRWMDPGSPGNPGWRLVGLGKMQPPVPTTLAAPIQFGAGSENGPPLPTNNADAKGIALYGYTISAWRIWAYPAINSGSLVLDLRVAAAGTWPPDSGDSIVAGTGPQITSGVEEDGNVSSWGSDEIAAGSAVSCVVVTNTAGVRKFVLALDCTRDL